ncbi:MAG: antitoxin [Actinomycetia bacterium]|nr:antitoxin [Actinomycetes bacterium]
MANVLIRNVPELTLRRIDALAARQELSRDEYLRRQLDRTAEVEPMPEAIDWARFAATHQDLLDPDVMEQAWQ